MLTLVNGSKVVACVEPSISMQLSVCVIQSKSSLEAIEQCVQSIVLRRNSSIAVIKSVTMQHYGSGRFAATQHIQIACKPCDLACVRCRGCPVRLSKACKT